jgi:hypothetical protein
MALVVGAVLFCVFLPFIGIPLGLLIMTVVIGGAWLTGKKEGDDD